MPRVRFLTDYNHTWPSRAVTFFPAGWSGLVKREVADAAIAKGKATISRKDATSPDDEPVAATGLLDRADDDTSAGAVVCVEDHEDGE